MKKSFILALLITLLGFLFSFDHVKAETISFRVREKLQDYWVYQEREGESLTYRPHVLEDNKGGIAYCIQPFAKLVVNKDFESVPLETSGYSEETIKKVELLAYYGFGYPGHTDKKWYTITQVLIWRTIAPNYVFYWRSLDNYNDLGLFKTEIKELENMVAQHMKSPHLEDVTPLVSDELIFKDTNNLLGDYEITSNASSFKVENDLIKVENNKEDIKLNFKKKDLDYKKKATIFKRGGAQTLFSLGNPMLNDFSLEKTNNIGSLKIKKVDKETKKFTEDLKGTTYGLYKDSELVKELVISDEGEASIHGLKFGKYTLKELKTNEKYELDKEEKEININSETRDVELVLENKKILKKVEIKKYKEEKELEPEENITFEIYEEGEEIKEVTTDSNGYVEFDLPLGKYEVKQKNTTPGYLKVANFIIDTYKGDDFHYELINVKVPKAGLKEVMRTGIKEVFEMGVLGYGVFKKYIFSNSF